MLQDAAMRRRYAAIPDIDNGLSPRHFLASAPHLLKDRQSGVCPEPNSHRCEDTGFPDECCPDTQFCFVDKDFKSGCCAIGNNCASVNICTDTAFFYCHSTSTIAAATTTSTRRVSTTPSSITRPLSTTSTHGPSVTVIAACCRRPCNAASSYQCPSSLGGSCCGLGQTCISNGCVATLPPASSTTSSSSIPSCATSNIPCTDGLGGCCHSGAYCTALASTGYCATGSAAPTDLRIGGNSGDTIVQTPRGGGGLSSGAKAGIGAGVAIGALLVIGATVWWWIARRRQAGGTAPRGSGQGSGPWGSARGGTETVVSMQQGSTPGGPDMAGRGTEDYFGPAAGMGPFTGAEGAGMARGGAVPVSPDQPGDIQPAVEIGEAMGRPAPVSPPVPGTRHEYWKHGAKTVGQDVELE